MKSVAVIGGGITGLTAAYRLMRQGISVTLFEGSATPGGVIKTVRKDGFLAECGPNTILETSPKISSLVHDLGLDPRRMYSAPEAENRYLVRNRKPVCLPSSGAGFVTTPMFSFSAKLRIIREPFIARSNPETEESVEEFVVRRLGREMLDYAIDPMVGGVYAGNPGKLSVKHAFPRLHALEQKYGSLIKGQFLGARERKKRAEVSKQSAKKLSFDNGLQVLIEGLQKALGDSLLTSAPVKKIVKTPAGWTVFADGLAGDGREFDAVLYAGTAHGLAALEIDCASVPDLKPLLLVHYPPVASIVLGYRREDVAHPLDGFGMLVPKVEGFNILGTLFSSTLFPNRAPKGCVLLTSYVGGARQPELPGRGGAALSEMTQRDLGELLGVKGKPVFENQYNYSKAIPQYEVGYGRHKELMNTTELNCPGLFIAGHFRDGVSLGDSLVSGHDTAGRIATFLQTQSSGPKSGDAKEKLAA
jgi:oxygen-dependent protoporphyrinogen oxidase